MKLTQWILFASGVISALLISTTWQVPIVAQSTQPGLLAQQTVQTTDDQLPRLAQTEALPAREPMMTMPILQGSVSVQIENMTANTITYQALGDTEPRTLEADGDIALNNLRVPTTVTFSYVDMVRDRSMGSGLTKAEVRSEADGMLHLVIQPTTDLNTEVSNLTVESDGNVFVF